MTLSVILSVDWVKIQKISKTALIAALESCAKKFDRNAPLAAKKCRILISIINDPWENTLIDFLNSTKPTVKGETKAPPPTYPLISNQSNNLQLKTKAISDHLFLICSCGIYRVAASGSSHHSPHSFNRALALP